MDLPPYFDSQAQAAAMLGISIYHVKSAKAMGCPAFRGGGRIRTKELLTWLAENRAARSAGIGDFDPQAVALGETSSGDWGEQGARRAELFSLLDFVEVAYCEKKISFEQFCAIGDKTIALVIKLGRVWDAGIDERGYRQNAWELVKKSYRQSAKSSG